MVEAVGCVREIELTSDVEETRRIKKTSDVDKKRRNVGERSCALTYALVEVAGVSKVQNVK